LGFTILILMEKNLMKTILGIFLSLLFPTASFSAELIKEKREVGHFECIQIHATGTLFFKQGSNDSLTIEAAAIDLPNITSEIKNGCLILGPKAEAILLDNNIHYTVTAKTLNSLALTGQTIAHLKLKNDESFIGKISGNGQITLQGRTQKQWLEINGTGVVNAQKLTTEKTSVAINGQGQATVQTLQELDVNINGAGIVQYYGNPKIHQKISGSGEIIPLE